MVLKTFSNQNRSVILCFCMRNVIQNDRHTICVVLFLIIASAWSNNDSGYFCSKFEESRENATDEEAATACAEKCWFPGRVVFCETGSIPGYL